MKNILITGADGQLGSEIQNIQGKTKNYFFTDASDLDITDRQAISDFVKKNNIQIVVNCAAYTNVDKAEDDIQTANLINNIAVGCLAEVCRENNASLIHISTDYVFGGTKNTPYSEADPTEPLGIYGRTKLEGEKAIQNADIDYLIIRTSWLYSLSFGHNFVKTIQRLSSERNELKVVFDQVGTPTNARDLAAFIVHIIEKDLCKKREVYHFSNEGVCSWFDFATEIVRMSGNDCLVKPCLSSEFPSKVKRPSYSVLDKSKLKNDFNYTISHWKEALKGK
ncbi:Spore coat polysaccharide biosynthesis protein spsK [Capnocytophaga canimorsus]|uniref:dTDP-4-dehydrorhamnose reductase n=1 Tax=Capnocytophaga canimorsus TaxID=28188 RepID=A0A0B7HL92_9FLAO|nr:dTDP-4-dehydrorhamnose reductase [Capnocytophaga canimorsus]ATA77268.1 NAD(P)-dependent oxidoreductase [Capnocytophaga canimorsus]PJI83573.1 dTDP-4-dehydrorhamnose reductase [Capnocytophaga canimorsus]CEN39429.1 Spore coat polysaccharide biosynthesis protein spsK [Capnocytophaga canimorsus]STA72504.1 dTDP-4-dehydrorhamnose reductase [Capnocytophaga canimorsus]